MLDSTLKVVVVGCGGIGTWLIPPLARYLAAEKFKGQLTLWDGDKFSQKNAERQDFPQDQVNNNKAGVTMLNVLRMVDGLSMYTNDEYVTAANVDRCVEENTVIITCVDNHPARALIAKAAQELSNVTVISAGNEKLDGNVHVYIRRNGREITNNIFDRHPEIATAKRGERKPGCVEEIDNGETQLLVTNMVAAATAMLVFFNLWNNGRRFGRERITGVPQEVYFDVGKLAIVPVLKGPNADPVAPPVQ